MKFQTHVLRYGRDEISFRVVRRERTTLAISVEPDLGVKVVAPKDAALDKIVAKVQKRAPWIQRQLRYFEQFIPRTPKRAYVSGETHLYLGRQYRLKVIYSLRDRVSLARGQLLVQSKNPKQPTYTKALLDLWYKEHAHAAFLRRLAVCRKFFPDPKHFSPNKIIVRQLKRRWGSMTSSGNLILNSALIQASIVSIDYVITHELCHLRYRHHGADFVRLLKRVMPDWENRKRKLESRLA